MIPPKITNKLANETRLKRGGGVLCCRVESIFYVEIVKGRQPLLNHFNDVMGFIVMKMLTTEQIRVI